jgi:hypothetical protein
VNAGYSQANSFPPLIRVSFRGDRIPITQYSTLTSTYSTAFLSFQLVRTKSHPRTSHHARLHARATIRKSNYRKSLSLIDKILSKSNRRTDATHQLRLEISTVIDHIVHMASALSAPDEHRLHPVLMKKHSLSPCLQSRDLIVRAHGCH